MQTISITQINSRQSNPPSPFIAAVIGLDFIGPEGSNLGVDIGPEANVDEEIAVLFARCEILCWRG